MDAPPARNSHDPHPITPECLVDCLKAVLCRSTFNLLARAYDAPFDPPETVGDVLRLYREHQLGQVWGLGHRRTGEIEVGLIFAGLNSDHTPRA
jgi:hypothetical protein